MTANKVTSGSQHIDVHLDLPPETVADIRNGKKSVSIIDQQTQDRIHVCQGVPGAITWKQAALAFSIIAAIVGNSLMIGQKMQKFETATEQIKELQRQVTTALNVAGQHGTEFASLRADLSTMMSLYDRLDANLSNRDGHDYDNNAAIKDWNSHLKTHDVEDKMIQTQLAEINRSLERLEKYHEAARGGS